MNGLREHILLVLLSLCVILLAHRVTFWFHLLPHNSRVIKLNEFCWTSRKKCWKWLLCLSSLALGIHTFETLGLYGCLHFLRKLTKIYLFLQGIPHEAFFFYFPLRVMVPFSITFGKTKNFWMMPLICSMFLKLCCFLLWKCLIFSPYHTVIFKTVVRYTGYSELIVIDYTHNCSQQRNSIFYKTIHINWNAIGKFESLI